MTSPLHRDGPHDSAVQHVTGAAQYVDDLPEPMGMLHAWVVGATCAHGRVLRKDATIARKLPGIHAILFAEDVPGSNIIGAIVHDEPLLAQDTVHFSGQPIAVVFAESRDQARKAADAILLTVEVLPTIIGIRDAIQAGSFLTEAHTIARGDVEQAVANAHLVIEGEISTGAQDHFYLEGQVSMVVPEEAGTYVVWSSTQHPSEVQREVASVLGCSSSQVVCKVPRMGGGFGGKESQASPYAALAALGAQKTGRAVKLRLERGQDMRLTGKRHPFLGKYKAGFSADGLIVGAQVQIYADGGWTTDLSGPILDRAMFHLHNCYRIPHLHFEGRVCRTNIASNTAFRGFGGPQGVAVIEEIFNRAAEEMNVDPAQLRQRNLVAEGDLAPYGQAQRNVRIRAITEQLMASSDYAARRAAIDAHNQQAGPIRRGIGYQPVQFGISFTAALLNQAGALVLVYTDGSIQLNHGGTEMGQGLHTKMRAIAADVFGVSTDIIRVMTTATDKVPNTSATAASSGTDLNGQAVRQACVTLRDRMLPVAAQLLDCEASNVQFSDGYASFGGKTVAFSQLAQSCWAAQISLSATGYYATPGIHYDASKGRGEPFFYFAYGASVTEVELDQRTGQFGVRRVDILHDCGASLIPAIDRGQVEGGFVQGLGWLTVEEMIIDEQGQVRTAGPSTYKIPTAGDLPPKFNVALLPDMPQPGVIGGSKAVGEPPFLLAISAVTALRHAIGSCGAGPVHLASPATHEAVLRAIDGVQR